MAVAERLIDTTILVDVCRNRPEAIAWVNHLPPEGRCVSIITHFELVAGCRNRREQRLVSQELTNYRTLPLTEDISLAALSWFERFHLSHGVGFLDTLIAATALSQGLTIATLNAKHFNPLPDLKVEQPY